MAVVVTLGLAVAGAHGIRLEALALAGAEAAAWGWMRLSARTLLLDDAGYAIEQDGKEKLRVAWSEVQKVRIDRGESAIYVDCGDKARNLFVPPRRGYGFRFADAEAACARVLAAVPADRVVEVERIDVP